MNTRFYIEGNYKGVKYWFTHSRDNESLTFWTKGRFENQPMKFLRAWLYKK